MQIARVAIGSALALGALALTAPTAAADDSGIRIGPGHASPGSTVTVSTTACGPDVTYGKGESEVGGQFHLFEGDRAGVLVGTFEVPEDAAPGASKVTVKCPPRIQMTDTVEITRRPSGPVAAGLGGAADTDGSRIALGGLLVAGAAVGGAVKARRRLRLGQR
ncbi:MULTISPECIES: sortase [Kitasatospora]|uniref:Sortase n=1 Tax=Kitasatospora arboriphila TaxID=258052 RepID=A0ABN1U643_9ACTN